MALAKTKKPRSSGEQTKKDENSLFDWRDAFGAVELSFTRNFAEALAEGVRHRIEQVVASIQKGIIGSFLFLAGIIFCLIAIAVSINDFFDLGPGFGFAVSGIFALVFGMLIVKK